MSMGDTATRALLGNILKELQAIRKLLEAKQ
jgi:hypothetical protein